MSDQGSQADWSSLIKQSLASISQFCLMYRTHWVVLENKALVINEYLSTLIKGLCWYTSTRRFGRLSYLSSSYHWLIHIESTLTGNQLPPNSAPPKVSSCHTERRKMYEWDVAITYVLVLAGVEERLGAITTTAKECGLLIFFLFHQDRVIGRGSPPPLSYV